MNEIINLPTSVRQRLEEAHTLASQNRMQDAELLIREAGRALATAQPEVCALLLAQESGHRGIASASSEINTRIVRTDRIVLGLRLGATVQTTTDTRTILKKSEFY